MPTPSFVRSVSAMKWKMFVLAPSSRMNAKPYGTGRCTPVIGSTKGTSTTVTPVIVPSGPTGTQPSHST
jgi:hypothetical protein